MKKITTIRRGEHEGHEAMSKQDFPSETHRFFVYSPHGNPFYFFDNTADRDAFAADEIIEYSLDGEWDEAVGQICVGELTGVAVPTVIEKKSDVPAEDWPHGDDVDVVCDYKIEPLVALDAERYSIKKGR